MIDHVFFRHPRSVGESYGEHARVAGSFGVALFGAGLACLVHAAIPVLFTRTASDTIRRLHARLSSRHASVEPHPTIAAEWQLTYEI
jgi:hypothetical protein